MGIPNKLKNMNVHVDGEGYQGIASEYEEPKLMIATEDWRGAGMIGPVKIDLGLQAMEAKLKMGGHVAAMIRKFGTAQVDGVRVRLTGAYQADNGSKPQAVEIYIGGRFTEIDPGSAKPGDDTEHEFTLPLSYYRREVDGRTEVEVDMAAGVFKVDGEDRYGEIMSIISS